MTGISIFIDSRITSVSPSATSTFQTLATISARTSSAIRFPPLTVADILSSRHVARWRGQIERSSTPEEDTDEQARTEEAVAAQERREPRQAAELLRPVAVLRTHCPRVTRTVVTETSRLAITRCRS